MWWKIGLGAVVGYMVLRSWAVRWWSSWDPNTVEGQERAVALALALRGPNAQAFRPIVDRLTPEQRSYLTRLDAKLPPPGTPLSNAGAAMATRLLTDETLSPADKRTYNRALAREVGATPKHTAAGPAEPVLKPGMRRRDVTPRRRKVVGPHKGLVQRKPEPPDVDIWDEAAVDVNPNLDDVDDNDID